jgi:hypothetical protein
MSESLKWHLLIECEPSENCVKCGEARKTKAAIQELIEAAEEKLGFESCAYVGPETVRELRRSSDRLRAAIQAVKP